MKRNNFWTILIIVISLLLISCGKVDNNENNDGTLNNACYNNKTCNTGLICNTRTNICISENNEGTLNNSCYNNKTCNTGLVCNVHNICENELVNPCDNITCGTNESCNQGTCSCVTGYVKNSANICIKESTDPCDNITCGTNESCNQGTCSCITGYIKNSANVCIKEDLCTNTNCPNNSHCEIDAGEAGCYCDDGYDINNDGSACIPENSCLGYSCPSNAHCELGITYEPSCYCDDNYVVDEAGSACIAETITEDAPFNGFEIWRTSDQSQLWGRWTNAFYFGLRKIRIKYPDQEYLTITKQELVTFSTNYHEAYLLSDYGEFMDGEYEIKFEYSKSNGDIQEKTITRTVENDIYLGNETIFSSVSNRMDYDGLRLALMPVVSGTITRINVYTKLGALITTIIHTPSLRFTNASEKILYIERNFEPLEELIITFEGVKNNYTYYTGLEVTVSDSE